MTTYNGITLRADSGPYIVTAISPTQHFYTDTALSSAVTLPATITTTTPWYCAAAYAGMPYTFTVTQPDGTDISPASLMVGTTDDTFLRPTPTLGQVAADTFSPRLNSGVLPTDHGFTAWTFPPSQVQTALAVATAGTVYVRKMWLPAGTVTNLHVMVNTQGNTLTSGQCFMGLFNSSKQLLSATADLSTSWGSIGFKTHALSAAQTVSEGWHYVGLFFNGTTGPALARGANSSGELQNANLIAASSIVATADTGRTTSFPATLGTFTAAAMAWWIATS